MHELTIEEATEFFSEFYGGEHHFPSEIKHSGHGFVITHNDELATFDFNTLTRLVVMAHDKCLRVGVQPVGGPNQKLRITLHKRVREGSMSDRHPTLEDHVEFIRSRSKYLRPQ